MKKTRNALPEKGIVKKAKNVRKKWSLAKDADFYSLAERVSATWLADMVIILLWVDKFSFAALVKEYATDWGESLSEGSERPAQTEALKKLDAVVYTAIKEVKIYIQKKFKKKNAIPHYARYGIIKQGASYIFPVDRNKRKLAFKLMVKAIVKDGFSEEEYGKKFWIDLQRHYIAAHDLANKTDGKVSEKLALKNIKRTAIKKVMISLRQLLRANYPDSFQAVYRLWGWQKEDL